MDKLAPAIEWLKKNGFWLASAFLALGMFGGWYVATGSVSTETSKFTNAVKQQISAARAIRSKGVTVEETDEQIQAHPNQFTEAGMKEEMSRQVDDIVEAWKVRHKAQASILKWPTEKIGSTEFVRVFGRFDPPETFPETFRGLGMEQFLTLYRENIPLQMDEICKTVKTNWAFTQEKLKEMKLNSPGGRFNPLGGGRNGARRRLTDEDLLGVAVIWEQANQDLWYKKLTQFRDFDDHTLPTLDPTPLQVYMLQQDLWLLEAMFGIIRQINGDTSANDLAQIKRIDHVAFGREARTQLGELTPVDVRLGGDDGALPAAAGAGGTPSVSDFDQSASTSPFHGRYVDQDFKPYSADDVRAVITGNTLPEDNIELIVSKRVPVRIALSMDERKITEFLAACANSPFAFEIHQVRINRHVAGEGIELNGGAQRQGGLGGGGGGRGGDFGDDYDEYADESGRGGGGGGRNVDEIDLKSTPVEVRTNYDVNVEFYGIVKIYNPVREKFLREAAGLEEVEVDPNDAASVLPPRDFVAVKE